MAVAIAVKTRGGSLDSALRISERALLKATTRALNRTADTVRSQAVKSIAADIRGAKQKTIREAFSIGRATEQKPEARVVAASKRIPLIDLAARQTRRGVTYMLGTGRRVLQSAFIARMKSGHVGVFKRRGRARTPIDERFGPSIPLVFTRRRIQQVLQRVIKDRLPIEMAAQAKYYLGRRA